MKTSGLGWAGALVVCLLPAARADKATPQQQTQAALHRLGGLYGPAWTLTYESVVTTRQYGPASGRQVVEATVHGVLQKPNRFRLEVMQNDNLIGLLVSDGVAAYIYSPQQGVYRKLAAPPDLALGGLSTPDKAFARLEAVRGAVAMTPTVFSVATRPDFLGTGAGGFTASTLTLHGKAALDCAWTEGGATEHIVFNDATGLPLRTTDSSTDKGGTTTEHEEDLTAVQVGGVPLPPSAFQWTPPADAKLVTDEKPSAPATPAPPSTTRRRRHRTSGASHHESGKLAPGKIIRPGN